MNAKAEQTSTTEMLKWLLVIAVLSAGVVANFYFSDHVLYLRVLGVLTFAVVAIAIALKTEKGRTAWAFLGESRAEVRKVVWPTRKETVHTTLVVMAVVLLVALFLWLLDSVLGRMAAWLLG